MLQVDRQLCSSCAVYLDLLLVKHAQPLQVDHIGQALSEGQAVRPDLLVQSVVSHQMDVGYPVCSSHRNVFASQLQLNHLKVKKAPRIYSFLTVLVPVFHFFCTSYLYLNMTYSDSSWVILLLATHTAYFIMQIILCISLSLPDDQQTKKVL